MPALGVIEMVDETVAFNESTSEPARPGVRRALDHSTAHSAVGRPDRDEAMREAMDASLHEALRRARYAAEAHESTTSLVTLAQSLEACGLRGEAIATARKVLDQTRRATDGTLQDPFAARIALELLLRAGELDSAAEYAGQLPIDHSTRLVLGSTFAEAGRFEIARSLLEPLSAPEKNATLAYLLLNEGNNTAAIPMLRAALRDNPSDAESAHNLSIALFRSGARRKAVSAALRATRSDPSRQDISLHYIELLLVSGQADKVLIEADRIRATGVQTTAKLSILQARASLNLGETTKAERFLSDASRLTDPQEDPLTYTEVESNLMRIRAITGRLRRESAIKQLEALNVEYPSSSVVVANLAQTVTERRHRAVLQRAFNRSKESMDPARTAYVSFQIAQLDGDNPSAGVAATKWVELEPENPRAVSTAMITLGIGLEQWDKALPYARKVLEADELDLTLLNNSAYVHAMAGLPEVAIRALTPYASSDPTLKATLGLAWLAAGSINEGMRLYREAAGTAKHQDHEFLSLITMYQAMVVRQLHLDRTTDSTMLAALSLAPVSLPDDWAQRPEFLRLQWVARRHGYPWPLAL